MSIENIWNGRWSECWTYAPDCPIPVNVSSRFPTQQNFTELPTTVVHLDSSWSRFGISDFSARNKTNKCILESDLTTLYFSEIRPSILKFISARRFLSSNKKKDIWKKSQWHKWIRFYYFDVHLHFNCANKNQTIGHNQE